MRTLLEKQQRFTECLGLLISYAYSRGYKLTLSDGGVDLIRKYESKGIVQRGEDRQHMKGSLHYLRLAQDLNLFVNGSYITEKHEAWDDLGEKWESLDPDAAWGGRFKSGDFNHISFRHNGVS